MKEYRALREEVVFASKSTKVKKALCALRYRLGGGLAVSGHLSSNQLIVLMQTVVDACDFFNGIEISNKKQWQLSSQIWQCI